MTLVVCVGDLMVDVLAKLPGPLAPGSDTPAPIGVSGGGAAANVAAWLSSVGSPAMFVGRVGDDELGSRAVDDLTATGAASMVRVDPSRPTGTCIVLVDPDGQRTMIPDSGANAGLGELDAASLLPANADCLYLSGYALLGLGSRSFALGALVHAREHGWLLVIDAASAAPLAGEPEFMDWIGRDLVLLANTDEAAVLTELDEPAAAAQSLALRCGQAVVKRGASGAVWSDGSGVVSVPAETAEVTDTTGAGDAFAAGFIAALLTGEPPRECLLRGAELAARSVVRRGARP